MRNLAALHLRDEGYLEDEDLGTTIANIIECEVWEIYLFDRIRGVTDLIFPSGDDTI
jgi:hypothetical protein